MTVAKEISKYKLHLLGVKEVGWERSRAETADEYTFFYRKGNDNHKLGTGFLYIISRKLSGSILDEVIGFFN
jgi:hypothetical protein